MNNYVAVDYQNPHATSGLKLTLELVLNTPEEEIERNVRFNSKKYPKWMQLKQPHGRHAVMIGGGGSINDHIDDIKELQKSGATIFGLNAASKWAHNHGIKPDHQVIIDAQEETSTLVDHEIDSHLFASRCNPKTTGNANNLTIFHMETGTVESFLPKDRVDQGGYVLVSGDATVGNCSLCVAYTQGYREFHVFGYDSSHREGKSHAYQQRMNNNMPTMEIEHGGKKYISSIAMSKQPESFLVHTKALEEAGCKFHVYGDGLLQAIYNENITNPDRRS